MVGSGYSPASVAAGLAGLDVLCQAVLAGYSQVWDQSGYRGQLTGGVLCTLDTDIILDTVGRWGYVDGDSL